MNWTHILKSRKDKDRTYEDKQGFDERRTKVSGGAGFDEDKFGRIRDNEEEDSFADNDEYEEEFLADMTRSDLMNKVRELISGMTKEDLIELLINSQGDINLDISYDVNNSQQGA